MAEPLPKPIENQPVHGSIEHGLNQDVSLDAILGGKIRLYQPRQGHRAGTDAVLLAAAASADQTGLMLDVGAGVGTAGLILANRCLSLRAGLIENDPFTAALAKDNLELNRIADRCCVYAADILSSTSLRAAGLMPEMADLIITNPPFADPNIGHVSPLASKRSAHVMPKRDGRSGAEILTAWIQACLALLAPGGTFLMIHRPDVLPVLLAAAGQRIGALTILPVHPQKGKPASRMLLRGKKGSRAPLSLAPALILQEQGRFTPGAEAIHRGEALIDW